MYVTAGLGKRHGASDGGIFMRPCLSLNVYGGERASGFYDLLRFTAVAEVVKMTRTRDGSI